MAFIGLVGWVALFSFTRIKWPPFVVAGLRRFWAWTCSGVLDRSGFAFVAIAFFFGAFESRSWWRFPESETLDAVLSGGLAFAAGLGLDDFRQFVTRILRPQKSPAS